MILSTVIAADRPVEHLRSHVSMQVLIILCASSVQLDPGDTAVHSVLQSMTTRPMRGCAGSADGELTVRESIIIHRHERLDIGQILDTHGRIGAN